MGEGEKGSREGREKGEGEGREMYRERESCAATSGNNLRSPFTGVGWTKFEKVRSLRK